MGPGFRYQGAPGSGGGSFGGNLFPLPGGGFTRVSPNLVSLANRVLARDKHVIWQLGFTNEHQMNAWANGILAQSKNVIKPKTLPAPAPSILPSTNIYSPWNELTNPVTGFFEQRAITNAGIVTNPNSTGSQIAWAYVNGSIDSLLTPETWWQTALALTAGTISRVAIRIKSALNASISAEARAKQIHLALDPIGQRMRTTAVTETKEGIRIISSSSRSRLTPAQRALLRKNEVEGTGLGHAEVTGINAARNMGLNPTGTAASRPICSKCADFLRGEGVNPLSPLK